ncbi:hypothetical protein JI742_06715 [Piscinibacter sp. Jin2]|uniref:Uncharacterized protein n=1 Tax=Aquariibacter lacus TaxID=2801332 RepID=A0A9X0XD24_9BURK|nr:hypothetical protein [Piscinibacter lacus]MBL0719579.1 hypothetical protein [Piscinibacter lacus]
MFGRNRPVVFDPYARRRRRMPAWLVSLFIGAALGSGGLWWAQTKWLPPRLSVAEGRDLLARHQAAQAQLATQATALEELRQARDGAVAELARLKASAGSEGRALEEARATLDALMEALPPDPRDGTVAVRAARFAARGGQLGYTLALSQAGTAPRALTLKLVVEGESASGTARSVELSPPPPPPLGRKALLQGSVALPSGLQARQVTVRVLAREGGESLGMRVLPVR